MAALTSAAVTNRTAAGATITFNAASIDCTVAQLIQLENLLKRLLVESHDENSTGTPATITIGALS